MVGVAWGLLLGESTSIMSTALPPPPSINTNIALERSRKCLRYDAGSLIGSLSDKLRVKVLKGYHYLPTKGSQNWEGEWGRQSFLCIFGEIVGVIAILRFYYVLWVSPMQGMKVFRSS